MPIGLDNLLRGPVLPRLRVKLHVDPAPGRLSKELPRHLAQVPPLLEGDQVSGLAGQELSLLHDQTGNVDGDRAGGPAWEELQKVVLKGLEAYTLDHLAWDTAYRLDS